MKRRLLCALVLAVSALPASAGAAEPRWKIRQKVSGDVLMDQVEPLGKADTWFFGTGFAGPGPDFAYRPMASHWDGRRIKEVPLPREVAGSVSDVDFASANDGWAVGLGNGMEVFVLRWDGRAWRLVRREPVRSAWPQVKALGRGTALVTGFSNTKGVESSWTFDGRAWSEEKDRLHLSDFSRQYALSLGRVETLARWNGRNWTKIRVGALPKPAKGHPVWLSLLEARSAREIWVVAERHSGEESAVTYLLRWNGRRWKRERIPLPSVHSSANVITSDGRGGLWVTASSKGLVQVEGGQGRPLLYHRLPSGKWKLVKTGKNLWDVARVPGTTSLWAIGISGMTQAIFTYGKAR